MAHDHDHDHDHDDHDHDDEHAHEREHGTEKKKAGQEHAHDHHRGHDHAHDHAHAPGEKGAKTAGKDGGSVFNKTEARQARRLSWVLGLTTLFFFVEYAGASLSESQVLKADALHLLMDIFALAMSLVAMRLSVRKPNSVFTFGLRRAEPLAALLNASLILLATSEIVHEGVDSLRRASSPRAGLMLVVAMGALVVNGISAWLLHGAMHQAGVGGHGHDHGHDHGAEGGHGHAHAHHGHHGHHLNLRGAWLHLLGDALGSVAALVAAIAIRMGAPAYIDSYGSFFVAIILIVGAIRLIRDALRVLLEAAPKHLPAEKVRAFLKGFDNVKEVIDVHVWTLGAGQDAITARIAPRRDEAGLGQYLSKELLGKYTLGHVTVQVDAAHGAGAGAPLASESKLPARVRDHLH